MIYRGILALSFTLNSRLLPPWLSKAQDSSEVEGGPSQTSYLKRKILQKRQCKTKREMIQIGSGGEKQREIKIQRKLHTEGEHLVCLYKQIIPLWLLPSSSLKANYVTLSHSLYHTSFSLEMDEDSIRVPC